MNFNHEGGEVHEENGCCGRLGCRGGCANRLFI